jgi:hypothetical protein
LAIASVPEKRRVAQPVAKIPADLDGMDKAEALAFVSRLFAASLYPCIWDRPQPMLAAPARSPGTDFESALTPPLLQAGGNVQSDNLI